MRKSALSLLLLTLAATGTLHAQTTMIYLQNYTNPYSYNNTTGYPDGQSLSTSSGDIHGAVMANAGPGGTSPADTISFDNSQYAIYGGGVGGYDSQNRVGTATATSLSSYVISFDVKATNLAANSDFTFTPTVSVIRSYGGNGSDTITGTPLTLTGGTATTNGFVHFSLNASTFTDAGGNFGATISASDYDQTIFQLLVGNSETPNGDLGSGAFNAGTSTIFIDNLEIDQIAAVPEPNWGLLVGSGLTLLCAARPLRRAFSGLRAV